MRIAFWSFGLTGSTSDPTDDLNFEASSTSRQLRRDRAEGGAGGALAPPLFCKNKDKLNKK